MTSFAIILPDGTRKKFLQPVTGSELAAEIGPNLAKAALAIKVDGQLLDLSHTIKNDASVEVITLKSEEALELIRHDAAHVMAEAVQELFPETQVTIGPAIENGFYYDFAREVPFSPDDLETIEKKMIEIIARDDTFIREEWERDRAISFFISIGEKYKAQLIADLPETETISIYRQGNWIDLCRGPHLPSTGYVGKAFKLQKLAGAYWRGNSQNEMLQRIYGTAWRNQKELQKHLTMLEEAEKRDHRRLGREMELFHFQEEAIGSVFWHPKGWTLYHTLEKYIRSRLQGAHYVEVKTPQLIDRRLWETSGHWDKFREHMFTAETEDERVFALKPMNCPGHVQIFRQGITSYRDLPLRMAEFGSCHRYEPSGALHGLMRVRAFTQDDAHIFCTEDQITSETQKFCELLLSVYSDLGFKNVTVKFADRPEIRAGENPIWDKAEAALIDAIKTSGLEYSLNPGEGAFYGPKLEFVLRDAIGRDWQCGTLQIDFVLPERLDASYINENGEKTRPVMLHRAILGSFERFIGILIENYAGRLPAWLAPIQTVIATITSDADQYAREVMEKLCAVNIRTKLDVRNEKINYKVREHSLAKIPSIIVIGKREASDRTVALRRLGGDKQEFLALDDAVARLANECQSPDVRVL